MATAAKRARKTTAVAATRPSQAASSETGKLSVEYVDITDIKPYKFNGRNNKEAVPAVAKSIRMYGFNVPVILDFDGNLLAGHTRVEAAKSLQMVSVPALRLTHLSPEQADAFRLIDNKTASIATYDQDVLVGEMSRLLGAGIDFVGVGWTAEEVDCMTSVVMQDCLDTAQVTAAAAKAKAPAARRAPQRVRIVIGEYTAHVDRRDYTAMIDRVRNLVGFAEEDIVRELMQRLQIVGPDGND